MEADPIFLFLDFDGVLHRGNAVLHKRTGEIFAEEPGETLFRLCPLLEKALADFPQVYIILSSNWVSEIGFNEAANRLTPDLKARAVSTTMAGDHMTREIWEQSTRGTQVLAFATAHRMSRWLALDDNCLGFENVPERLLWVDTSKGIEDDDLLKDLRDRLLILADPQRELGEVYTRARALVPYSRDEVGDLTADRSLDGRMVFRHARMELEYSSATIERSEGFPYLFFDASKDLRLTLGDLDGDAVARLAAGAVAGRPYVRYQAEGGFLDEDATNPTGDFHVFEDGDEWGFQHGRIWLSYKTATIVTEGDRAFLTFGNHPLLRISLEGLDVDAVNELVVGPTVRTVTSNVIALESVLADAPAVTREPERPRQSVG
jgi:hypothetical protein